MQGTKAQGSFEANIFAITASGRAMPGRYLGEDAINGASIQSPTGKIYSFAPENLITCEEARERLHMDRVSKVFTSYTFETISRSPLVVRVQNPEHPRRSNYVITQLHAGQLVCTCGAWSKDGQSCKHTEAWQAKAAAAIRLMNLPAAAPAAAAPVQPVSREDW